MKKFLILFAKDPVPGKVKTRLVPFVTPQEGAQLAEAFLYDSVERFSRIGGVRRVLACEPRRAIPKLKARIPDPGKWEFKGQARGSLGARLRHMARWSFKEGSRATIFLGSDSPTLPVVRVRDALRALKKVPVVLGPSLDGGYYLLGMNRPLPALFTGIPWSTDHVLSATLARLRKANISYRMLRPWYDVDTSQSLRFIQEHLISMKKRYAKGVPPRTARVLHALLHKK